MKIDGVKKTHSIIHRKSYWYPFFFPITLFLIVSLLSGCITTKSKQPYLNSETGISLEKPENWDVKFIKRSGSILLEAKNGVWNKDSARIEIWTGSCPSEPKNVDTPQTSSYEILEQDIDRIKRLYNLNLHSLTVVQKPIKVESKNHEITKAVIVIPTMSMLDDSPRNQVGGPGPDIFQTIDLFVITDGNDTIMAYIYKGNSDSLNSEAQEIVNSLQRTCAGEP